MSLPPLFDGLSEMDTTVALRHFQEVSVGAREPVIAEGDVDPTIAVVLEGELVVKTGDTRLGYVRSGEIVGEMAMFSNGMRTATVTAVTNTRLLVLDVEGFRRLRSFRSPILVALEEHALQALTHRLREISGRIAELAEGTNAEAFVPHPSFFARMTSVFGGGGEFDPVMSPDKLAVLQKSPLFQGIPDDELQGLAAEFSVSGFSKGHLIITEGKPGNNMYILARGLAEVVVSVGDGNIERLAVLEPGEAFGMCALVQERHTRMASCIAREKTVCLSMDRIHFASVIHRADETGSALRVGLIRAVIDQLAYANGQLALHEMQSAGAKIRRAGAGVEAHGRYLSEPDYLADT